MELPEYVSETALTGEGYVIDAGGREATKGNARRYFCENCGLWSIRKPDPICKACRKGRRENPKGYPRLF
jgi:hypothetical protein